MSKKRNTTPLGTKQVLCWLMRVEKRLGEQAEMQAAFEELGMEEFIEQALQLRLMVKSTHRSGKLRV